MSDSEEEYEYSDEEDQEDQDEEGNEVEIEIENAYYEGEDLRSSDARKALELFEKVVKLELEHSLDVKWRFKALEHAVVLHLGLGNFEDMVSRFRIMLGYISNSSVTRNECTGSINSVLEAVSAAPQAVENTSMLSQMYEIALTTLKQSTNNERLWFNTCVRYGKACLAAGDVPQVRKAVADLHASCRLPDGRDDPAKGTYLLEVYALEIQLCSATKDTARMKALYPKTLNLNAAVADPRIMGVIREEGGKMYMTEGRWNEAYNEFYEGFRGYQEAGNPRAKDALKYVVLANMLALSDINPFAAREAIAFQEEREIVAMRSLRTSYEANDLNSFERTLKDKSNRILEDPFIMTYVEPLRRRMREQVLLALVRPYHRIKLSFIATELKLSAVEVERLVVDMILEDRVKGKIDQIKGFLLLGDRSNALAVKKFDAMASWAKSLEGLHAGLSSVSA